MSQVRILPGLPSCFVLLAACCGLLSVSVAAAPARSQSTDKIAACNTLRRASVDGQIKACTDLILSGGLTDKQLAQAYKRRGEAYFYFLEENDLALSDLDAAIRLDPDDPHTFYVRGDARKLKAARADGDDARELAALALDDFNTNIRLETNPSPLDYINRSNAFVLLGDYERAIEDLDEALRLDPSDERFALANRCAARLMMGKTRQALADCDAAAARPYASYPLGIRALVHLRMGNHALSMRDANAAFLCATTPYQKAMALYARGLVRRESGDISAADADFAAAKRALPAIDREIARYGLR